MNQTKIMMALLFTVYSTFGGDWMQWRGPGLNGTCDATNLPTSWSVESGKNIAWKCPLPGGGSSTPIVAGDFVFLTTSTDDLLLYGICIDRKTGEEVWKKKLGTGRMAMRSNTMASPSATSDGERVYFLFGQGTLAALSLDGKLLWKRELEEDHGMLAQKFGFSSSPLLHNGNLYIPLLYLATGNQKVPNPGTCLMAIDAKTGKTVWTKNRPSPARKESFDSYITPILGKDGGIILTGADLVTSHDPATGKEHWRFDFAGDNRKSNWRIIAGPVSAVDLVVTPYPRGRTLVALNSEGRTAWEYRGYVPDVCTPAHDNGLLYVLDGVKRYLTCLDAMTGQEVWQEKIDSDKGFFASPLVADGKIYLLNLKGEVFVYAAGREKKFIGRFAVGGDNCAASIIAVDDTVLVRTDRKLICARNQTTP